MGDIGGGCIGHCKNTGLSPKSNQTPPRAAAPPLPASHDGCKGSETAGKTKILKSNDSDKQKALNSVGHRCTICQGTLRREEGSVESRSLRISGLFQPDNQNCPACLPSRTGNPRLSGPDLKTLHSRAEIQNMHRCSQIHLNSVIQSKLSTIPSICLIRISLSSQSSSVYVVLQF